MDEGGIKVIERHLKMLPGSSEDRGRSHETRNKGGLPKLGKVRDGLSLRVSRRKTALLTS